MRHTGRLFNLILICLAAALVVLFTIQNLGRVSDLSLNLWVVAYKLKTPQPIPYMIIASFGSGLLLAGFLGTFQRISLQRRVRELEREAAKSSLRQPDDDWT